MHHPETCTCLPFPSAPLPSLLLPSSRLIEPVDRYQTITQHEPYEIICGDTNLNFQRTDKLVLVQVFQQGRDAESKKALYAEGQRRLERDCGVPGTDLIVTCSANTKEDWCFGIRRAQFLTGEL
jgi:hypothetical protein